MAMKEKGRGRNGAFKRYEVEIFRDTSRSILMNQWLLMRNDDDIFCFELSILIWPEE